MSTVPLVFEANVGDLKKAETALKGVDKAGKGASNSVDKYNKSSKELAKEAKEAAKQAARTSNKVNQVGFQLQDFAVQLQGGQSAFVAFSQQGSQLVSSLFTPMLGLATALAGMIGGQLYNAFNDTTESVDLFATALKSANKLIEDGEGGAKMLNDEFERLAKFSKAAAISQLNSEMLKLNKAMNSGRKSITENLEELGDWNVAIGQSLDLSQLMTTTGFGRFGTQLTNISKAFKISKDDAKEFTGLISSFFAKDIGINDFRKSFDELFNTLDEKGQKSLLPFRDSLAQLSNGTISLQASFDLAEKTVKDLDLAMSEASSTGIKLGQDLERSLEKVFEIEAKRKALAVKTDKELLDLGDAFAAKNDQLLDRKLKQKKIEDQISESRLKSAKSFTQQSLSILEQGAKEGSALAKAAFIANKVLTISQMIVDTEAAATAGLKLGPAYSALIRGVGYASIGVVAGQSVAELSGRAQGGQVRDNQSYLVGENGPEIFNPRGAGNITPNHALGASNDAAPINVVTNVRVLGGSSDATATTNVTKTDRNIIVDIVVDQLSNPSSKSRQGLGRTSNIQNAGYL